MDDALEEVYNSVFIQTFSSRKYAICCGECGRYLLDDLEVQVNLLDDKCSRKEAILRYCPIHCSGCDEVYCSEHCKAAHRRRGHLILCPCAENKNARSFMKLCRSNDNAVFLLAASVLAAEVQSSSASSRSLAAAASHVIDAYLPLENDCNSGDKGSFLKSSVTLEDFTEKAWILIVVNFSSASFTADLTLERWLILINVIERYAVVVGEESPLIKFYKQKSSRVSSEDRLMISQSESLRVPVTAALRHDEEDLADSDIESIRVDFWERAYSRLVQNSSEIFINR